MSFGVTRADAACFALFTAAALGALPVKAETVPAHADAPPFVQAPLEQGFRDLYNLSFPAAHSAFEQFGSAHPQDPRAPAFDAAAYLFSEFNRLHILQAQFFVNDKAFEHRNLHPDAATRDKFEKALERTQQLADARLRTDPKDEIGLFANVLRLGLHADYLSLIEKRDFDALRETKQGRELAEQLLTLHPDCYDAYIAVGVENYLLSLKPAPIRWFLHATGAQTDKETGIQKLQLTAEHGHYLQPYAQLLLAVAALRDGDDGKARRYLSDLATRFPGNPLYAEELRKLP